MPRFEDGSYGNAKGIALIAKVLAGKCSMHYTRVAVGNGTIPEDMTPKTMGEPAGYIMDGMIASVTNPIDGECQVTVQVNSAQVERGFYATGLVLYASDPDEGEVPYTYLVLENEPEWIRPSSSIVGKLATFDIIAAVGDVDAVTATIDPNSIVTAAAVQQMIKDHNEDEGAHGALMEQMKDALNVNGLLKGNGKGTVSAAKAGTDYQQATKSLKSSVEMALDDTIPFYSAAGKENRRVSLQVMKDALGVQSPTINVVTCARAAVTCVKGSTTLNSEGPGVISLPGIGTWTVTATLDGKSVSKQVEVTGAMQYTADLMITSSVAITSMPTKTTYRVGEAFDGTGLVVTATYADDTTENVTGYCTFSPSVMAAGTTQVTITYERAGITLTKTVAVTVRQLSGIAVTTAPVKTAYTHGEKFNSSGMVITATYDDGSAAVVTGWTYSPTGNLAASNTAITISYTEGNVTKTCTQPITVQKVLSSIAVATPPSKTSYYSGDKFSSAGMVIKATYTDGTSANVTGWTYSPTGNLTASNNSVTISYTEGGVTKTCALSITVTAISNTMNSNSWATIKSVSNAGKGANYWAVGDTKNIKINGKVGNFTFSNLSIDVFILGFNHNANREGSNRIHFQIGKIGGKLVGLCDSQFSTEQTSAGYFNMNTSRSNNGGWNSCNMRRNILGNTGTPTSPPANTLLAALPADLRAVMKPVTKYTDNTANGTNVASNVTGTTDYLFLLAEFEVFGARYYANSAEQNYQLQYDYYKAGNSKIHYKHSATGTAVWVWLRSPCYGTDSGFCGIGYSGTYSSCYASWSAAVAPGFAV